MKLSNSPAKAGPMSEANALGLICVPCLALAYFESQSGLSRINQRYLNVAMPDYRDGERGFLFRKTAVLIKRANCVGIILLGLV